VLEQKKDYESYLNGFIVMVCI